MKTLLQHHDEPKRWGCLIEHALYMSGTQTNAYWAALHEYEIVDVKSMEQDAEAIHVLLMAAELLAKPKQGSWIHTLLQHMQREAKAAHLSAEQKEEGKAYLHLYEVHTSSRILLMLLSFKQDAPWITAMNIAWGIFFLCKYIF